MPEFICCPFFVSIAVLGPPHLSTRTTASALFVHVTLQEGPNGVSIADIINSSKEGFTKTIPEYILRIIKPEWAAQVSSLNVITDNRLSNKQNSQTRKYNRF